MMNISRLTRNVQVKQFGKRFLNAAKQRPAWMGDTGNMMQYKTSQERSIWFYATINLQTIWIYALSIPQAKT
jgi:hypothetical protein